MIPVDELRRMYVDEQLSTSQIGARIGMFRENVRYHLRKNGIPLRSKGEAKHLASQWSRYWTPERDALLTQRWTEGAYARAIARELGPTVTRAAVIGRAHRLNLDSRPNPSLPKYSDEQHAQQRTYRRDKRAAEKKLPVPPFRHRSVLTFLPENPRLEMEFRRCVAAASAGRIVNFRIPAR